MRALRAGERPAGKHSIQSGEQREVDFETARFNMVEQQIRPWDVLDQAVLDRIADTPREAFVPPEYREVAYADMSIPLGAAPGEEMMPPREEARLLQALALTPSAHALEIGTGSGYLAALMAGLARQVTTVELSPELKARAEQNLAGCDNVAVLEGDGAHGWPDGAPYDAIAVTGSLHVLDEALLRQLKPGGRLFVVVGEAPAMEAQLITRMGASDWATESLFETVLPPLVGATRPNRFEF